MVRWPVRKFARVGRPLRRSARSARISAGASLVAVCCPQPRRRRRRGAGRARRAATRRARSSSVSASAAPAMAAAQASIVFGALERVERRLQAIDELGEPPGDIDRAAVDVVEREDVVEQPLLVLGHGHADEQPVHARAPRARGERVELERRAMRGVEAPPNPARRDPVLDASEVVVVEPEPPPHRLLVGEVEHLRGGQPLVDEVEQPRHDAEHRVGLPERAVRQPDAQVRRAHIGRQRVQLVVVLEDLARPERRLDERRERLDVRAHDDHVARLERSGPPRADAGSRRAGPRPAARARGRRGPARSDRPRPAPAARPPRREAARPAGQRSARTSA